LVKKFFYSTNEMENDLAKSSKDLGKRKYGHERELEVY
jgi:hypothetical protein